MGLREEKKEQTRQLIMATAWRLFADRGFDQVTVAQVAQAARVAETTVFNYFKTKEDLFYSGLEGFGAGLVEAVRTREAGQTALAAFRRFLLDGESRLDQITTGDPAALERMRSVMRIVTSSPRLLAWEQEAFARITDSLTTVLAAETGANADDLSARAAANALMGVHRSLVAYVRHRILANDRPTQLAADVRASGTRAFALLERGLGNYAVRTTDADTAGGTPAPPAAQGQPPPPAGHPAFPHGVVRTGKLAQRN